MKRIIGLLLAISFCFCLVSCGGQDEHIGEAKTPSGSAVMKGQAYQDVIEAFEEKGFTNIKTEEIDDLVFGWLTEDGEVEEVSVGGDVEYAPDKWVPADIEVIIRYHTFPEETLEEETPKVDENLEEEKEQEYETEESVEEEVILNVENCPDLAAILETKDEFDPRIGEFSEKYYGQKIEFDGYTADVARHENYNTRFDYLICVGDYNDSSARGPYFQIRDVNYNDLNLVGENVPDTFGTGLNIHIVATVGTYSDMAGLFQIEPEKITMR